VFYVWLSIEIATVNEEFGKNPVSGILDREPDRRQNLTNWSLGHTPPLQKISSKSVDNFLRYTAECQFTPYLLMAKNSGLERCGCLKEMKHDVEMLK